MSSDGMKDQPTNNHDDKDPPENADTENEPTKQRSLRGRQIGIDMAGNFKFAVFHAKMRLAMNHDAGE